MRNSIVKVTNFKARNNNKYVAVLKEVISMTSRFINISLPKLYFKKNKF